MTPEEYKRTFGVVVRREYILVKTHWIVHSFILCKIYINYKKEKFYSLYFFRKKRAKILFPISPEISFRKDLINPTIFIVRKITQKNHFCFSEPLHFSKPKDYKFNLMHSIWYDLRYNFEYTSYITFGNNDWIWIQEWYLMIIENYFFFYWV